MWLAADSVMVLLMTFIDSYVFCAVKIVDKNSTFFVCSFETIAHGGGHRAGQEA
jgi:hypothetical protein